MFLTNRKNVETFRLPILHIETVDSYFGLYLRKGEIVNMAPAANERIDPKTRASMQSSRAGSRLSVY